MNCLYCCVALVIFGWSLSYSADLSGSSGDSALVINELIARPDDRFLDEDGDAADWVEITNRSDEAVSLAGWFLTDDPEVPQKWAFPETSVAAGSFLLVYASGKDRGELGMPLHANFKLNEGGEYLALTAPEGSEGQSLDYPNQREGMSFGLDEEGVYRFFSSPTLAAANGDDGECYVADTKFSVDRGFYTEAIEVEIACATPDAVIRYTTDGNEPSAGTLFGGSYGTIYNGPITIDKTTVLRAHATKAGWNASNIDTQTYLFLDDVIRQSPNKEAPPGWPEGTFSGQRFDYGMDPEVVDDPEYADQMIAAMQAIPSMSLVLDQEDLTDPRDGIYTNAREDGRDWERPGSLELLNADGTPGFHINAGVRIRGGFSRDGGNAKHSFRLFFRSEYGESKLRFPLFEDEGIDEFKKFDFRTAQNYAWSLPSSNDGKRNTFLREIFARDSQRAMGQPYTRSRYYHLYLNGIYWGLFMSQERSTDDYAASYFGGEPEDYDVIKVEAGPYTVFATEGTIDAYDELHALVKDDLTDVDFYALQGLTPEGEEDLSLTKHIDVDNLIDYMMTIFYVGSFDAPLAGTDRANNFYAIRNRNVREGWRFFCHDTEHSMLSTRENRMGPYPAGRSKQHFNPQYLHQQLMQSDAYRLAFADRVRAEFFNDGVFTVEAARERWNARKAEIDLAIIAESARWGDQRGQLYTKEDWLEENRWVLEDFMSQRTETVFNQMKFVGLTGDLLLPEFAQHGGVIEDPGSFRMKLTVGTLFNTQDGEVYYTTDGSDPRMADGSVSEMAILYDRSGPGVPLTTTTQIRTRLVHEGQWSPINEATFIAGGALATADNVIISEIMYHPAAPPADSAFQVESAYEYIELWNPSDEVVDLTGARFSEGIRMELPVFLLEPGQRAVVVHTQAAFEERYGSDLTVIGAYGSDLGGKLSNSGERLALVNIQGDTIADFSYNDGGDWPGTADGGGASLVRETLEGDPALPELWGASPEPMGSPGAASGPPPVETGYALWKEMNMIDDDSSDEDGDGLVALVEYAMGGDPNGVTQLSPIRIEREEAGTLIISVVRALAADDIEIAVEASDDLVSWDAVGEAEALAFDTLSETQRRYRWRVTTGASATQAFRARYLLKD